MTQLLSHVSQSPLGETCAFYVEYIAGNVPTSLRTLQHKFITAVGSARESLPLPLRSLAPAPAPDHAFAADQVTLIVTLLACVLAAVALLVMSSWRSPFNFWRRSPQYSGVSNPPHVSDSDYSYITPDDIVGGRPTARGYGNQYAGGAQDTEPDTLLLKHRKDTYELHFPAYAINDGVLSVAQLRQRAAEVTRSPDPKRVKLLYKGKLLDDDTLPCRSEGLKQQSEVLCVVSEVHPGESTPSDVSEAEANKSLDDTPDTEKGTRRTRNRKNKKGKKKKSKDSDKRAEDTSSLAPPPVDKPKPSSSGLPSPAPSLKNLRTSLEQVQALTSYLHTELLPLCEEYIANTPTEPKSRDFEHKKLSETILAQVILKADGIEPDGDPDARNARRALVKEAQTTLTRLDVAAAAQ